MANQIPVINYDSCYGCKACFYNCPVSLFDLSHHVTRRGMRRELPVPKEIDRCIGCGVCARSCPVEAITMQRTEPAEGKEPVYVDYEKPIRIDPNKCKGCTACARICPGNAIEGKVKVPHVVHEDMCLKCGLCIEKCKFGAIYNSDEPVPELIKKEEPAKKSADASAGEAADANSGEATYRIDPEKCKGCTACKKVCPADAIKGELKVPHEIIQEDCLHCGACFEKCRLGAIIKE